MPRIEMQYLGDLHCRARHEFSGEELVTDAPVDNQGRGSSFSPTDLVATSLGTCILTIMGIAARREGLSIEGTRVTVDKTMSSTGPRRIARLEVRIDLPLPRSADVHGSLAAGAESCPVSRSLHPDLAVEVELHWQPEA